MNQKEKIKKPKFIIPPPVDTTLFSPSQNYSDNKEIIESFRELIVIGTIANINKTKGLETFIRAGSFLNKNFNNLHFIIIGEVFAYQRKYFNILIQESLYICAKTLLFLRKKKLVLN